MNNETENNTQVCEENGGNVVEFPSPPEGVPQPVGFVTLALSPVEALLTYQAYRVLLRHYAAQEVEPLDNIQQVVALMATLKPGAVEASKLFQGGSQQ